MRGVKKVVPVGDSGRRRRRRQFLERQDRARRPADRLGRGPERQGHQRHDRRHAEGGARRRAGLCRQQGGRCQGGARRRGESGRGGLQLPLPEPRADGADERHRALYAGKMRGLVPDAERRGDARGGCRSVRPAGREMRRLQAAARRRVRPARRLHRLCAPGGADRDADAGHAGQAAVDARRGHDARLLSPDHAMQIARRAGCGRQSRRPADAHFRAVDPGRRLSAELEGRHGPGRVPGPQPGRGRSRVRLQHPERC